MDTQFLSQFPIEVVGGSEHTEHWIPAEHLSEFNQLIIGKIVVFRKYTQKGEVGRD